MLAIITDSGVFNSWDASAMKRFCLSKLSFTGRVMKFVTIFDSSIIIPSRNINNRREIENDFTRLSLVAVLSKIIKYLFFE